jgi:hypothetical protein
MTAQVVRMEGAQAPSFPPLPAIEMVAVKLLHCDNNRLVMPSEDEIRQMAAILEADGAMHNPVLVIRQIGAILSGMNWPNSELLRVIDGATRASAARFLKWQEIPARVYEAGSLTEDQLRYLEARANLTRRNLPALTKYILHLEEMESGQRSGIYETPGGDRRSTNAYDRKQWYEVAEREYGINRSLAQRWFAMIRVLRNDTGMSEGGISILPTIRKTWADKDQSNLALLERLAKVCDAIGKRGEISDAERKVAFKPVAKAIAWIGGRGEQIDQQTEEMIERITLKPAQRARKPRGKPSSRKGGSVSRRQKVDEAPATKSSPPTDSPPPAAVAKSSPPTDSPPPPPPPAAKASDHDAKQKAAETALIKLQNDARACVQQGCTMTEIVDHLADVLDFDDLIAAWFRRSNLRN